jgi:hypothetical protein
MYVTHTERRDLTPRVEAILQREGFRVAVLKAHTVPAERREEWVAARVREGLDVLVCHPCLVQTGLDLVEFPSIVWLEPEYSLYTLRQSSRRSWRIGQREPVEVTHLVYDGTLQAEALALVAAKLRSALLVEGELPDDGLAALEGDEQDLFIALARRLTEAGATDDASLEALFAETCAIELEADEYLADADWLAEVPGEADAVGAWQPAATPAHESVPQLDPLSRRPRAGRVLTLDELAGQVPQRRVRPRRVPDGQLTLFGT